MKRINIEARSGAWSRRSWTSGGLPAAVARAMRLRVDQRVSVSVQGDQVVITPVADSRLSLAQRLATYDRKRHGGELMAATRAVGAERW